MKTKDERRVFERHDNDAPVIYAYHNTDRDTGSDIYIMMENYAPDTIHAELYEGYFAEVRWCRQLPDTEVPGYKVGVKYYKTVID
jgi:hypothetical protein